MEHLFVMEDWHNFGADYDKTLMAWHKNFVEGWDDDQTKLRRAVLPDVDLLPVVLRRSVPRAPHPAVADRPLEERTVGRLSLGALT